MADTEEHRIKNRLRLRPRSRLRLSEVKAEVKNLHPRSQCNICFSIGSICGTLLIDGAVQIHEIKWNGKDDEQNSLSHDESVDPCQGDEIKRSEKGPDNASEGGKGIERSNGLA